MKYGYVEHFFLMLEELVDKLEKDFSFFKVIKNGNKIELIDTWTNDLNFIPIVVFYGTLDYSNLNANSIIKDIVELNNSHYNLASGLMNISHIVSNPIPILYGQPQNLDRELKLGVNSVIMFPTAQNNAYKFEWVEVLGNGVKIAEREIDKLEEYIISISFDILRVDKINKISGMDITFVTSAQTDKEALSLLTALGLPFKKSE